MLHVLSVFFLVLSSLGSPFGSSDFIKHYPRVESSCCQKAIEEENGILLMTDGHELNPFVFAKKQSKRKMDIVLNAIVSSLLDKLVGLASEELHSILDVHEEVQKLRDTLRSIQAVLNDAERRQIAEQGVKNWLSNLRDIMYDADDILDECRIMADDQATEDPSGRRRYSPYSIRPTTVLFYRRIGVEIKDLNKRMEKISVDKSNFDLRVSDRQREVGTRVRRETSSGVEPDIVGEAIEKDTRDFVNLLMRKDEDATTHVVVLAIVGLGGIGKTTLAQMIFNDNKLKAVFEKTMWVCVSQEVVETTLLKDIILKAGGTPGEALSKVQLEEILVSLLKDIKFFLVLDDVWDPKIWDDCLRKPLQVGAVGSRVLVTTRNKGVAARMKAHHIHHVDALSSDDSWLLMRKKVTKNAEEERDVESLKDIGMRIVEKCQGLPLAISVIGGVLCGEFRRWKWEGVECNSAWSREGRPEGVHQALYLSYEDLPSHLKQCFLHCSLFPEDSWLVREDLVQLWVAEGFVVEVEGEEYHSPEEIAHGYLDELIQRSLLQVLDGVDSILDGVGSITYGFSYYKMHDLLRLMCHFLATGENLVITDVSKRLPADDDTGKLRRLSIVASKSQDIKPILHVTQKHKSLRTLMLYDHFRMLDDKDVEDCLENFRRLRVARLCYRNIQSLPYSAGNLLHLRYLNLSRCDELKSLPESIGSLHSLQFLILESCDKLHTLPKGVVQLRNLRTLNVDYTSLELPSGIGRLEHLNVLKGATISLFSSHNSNNSSSSSSSCSLEEICQLRKLRELFIKLRMTTSSNSNVNGLNISLRALKYLLVLTLDYSDNYYNYSNDDIYDSIFDVILHPPSCVCQIQIYNFLGHQFPQWLMSRNITSLLPNLKVLEICDCYNCLLLPPLGKLPNLKVLCLDDLHAVTNIGAEFFGYEEASTSDGLAHQTGGSKHASSSLVLFPRLKGLRLQSLSTLEAWDWVPEVGGTVAMPQLNELRVCYCPKLSSLPEELTRQATRLTSLDVMKTNINSFSGFPALERLKVEVHDVGNLSLPNWLVHNRPYYWTSLEMLKLRYTNQPLRSNFLQDDPGWPAIREIPDVQIVDYHGNYIKHSSTFPTTFDTNLTGEE